MKKSKILVPALAVLALGIAGSAAGTVAWFQLQSMATFSGTASADQTISAVADTATLGNFDLSIDSLTCSSSIHLSDASGRTYVYVGDATSANKVEVSVATADKVGTISFKVKATYSGDLTSVAEINAAWAAAVDAQSKFEVTASAGKDDDGYLKFFASSTPSGDGWAGAAANAVVEVPKSDLSGLSFSGTAPYSVVTTSSYSIYFGVTGKEGSYDATTDKHVVKVTPSATAKS